MIELDEIGLVKKHNEETFILLEDEYWDATLNLDKFSHLIVIWWIDGHDNPESRGTLVVTPKPARGNSSARSGVFACRSPVRPNPIGHSVVALIGIQDEGRRIVIDRIDARDGTPVVDIKPYMPTSDRVDGARVPSWFEDLEPRYYH